MTDEEMRTFLGDDKLLASASIGANGGPRVVPMTFMYDGGRFYMSPRVESLKVSNISGNGKVAFSLASQDPSKPLKAVVGKSNATILSTGFNYDEKLRKLVAHLVESSDHPCTEPMMQSDHALIEIAPTSITSWNDALRRQGVI